MMNKRNQIFFRNIICLLFTIFIIIGCAPSTHENSKQPSIITNGNTIIEEKNPLYIVGIGDSLTAGTGDEENKHGYVGRLVEKWMANGYSITMDNLAVKGLKSHKLLKQLRKNDVKKALQKADFIFVTIGANDFLALIKEQDFSAKRINEVFTNYIENLQQIMQTIENINGQAPIIFIGLYNPFGVILDDAKHTEVLIEQFNEISAETVQTIVNGHYIPIHDIFLHKSDHLLADDYFHPNGIGYEEIAKRLYQYIEELEGTDGKREKTS